MPNQPSNRSPSNLGRAFRKFFLTVFVAGSFILYALHKSDTPATSAAAPGTDAQNALIFTPTALPPANTTAPSDTPPARQENDDDHATATLPPLQSPTPRPQGSAPTNPPRQALAPTAVPPTKAPGTQSGLKDGTFTGPEVDAFFGFVQVQAVVKSGRLSSVQFLEYPSDRRTSQRINQFAVPRLQQEAVQAQNYNVNIVTGATLTSEAFMSSLQQALAQAQGS
jgi:uncharacterized protein with FMN-binding domain